MKVPVLSIAAVALLAALLPLPRHYVDDGSLLHALLVSLRLPLPAVHFLLHPLLISPLAHYLLLFAVHFALSYPARYFLLGFGLHVSGFNGSSLRGLVIKARVRRRMEVVLRADEVGFDIRTMRRLRMRLRERWAQLRNWRSAADTEQPEQQPPGLSASEPDSLSKRVQLYARGVRIQLLASPENTQDDIDPLWFFDAPEQPPPAEAAQAVGQESQGMHMSRLAKKISTILRTYTYVASLLARWIDICITDVSIMIVQGAEMARAGRGITLHVSSASMWAESVRESAGSGWNFPWIHPQTEAGAESSHKYLSTLAVEFTGLRLMPGIEGPKHMNSRWELVKMLVMQDMLSGAVAGDGDRPHGRGPAVVCQRCTVRSDVVTTFWGLPKRVDQRFDLGQTHVRAGVLDALLDEISIMRMTPSRRTPSLSARGLRALNDRLATVLSNHGDDGNGAPVAGVPTPGHALFLLHDLLSRLRLEHVSITLRLDELVADLPLTAESLIVEPSPMVRWRQRGIEIEGGYRWASASTAYARAALGSIQVTALHAPSMTPDMRTEEQREDTPGLHLRECTVHGEMSAFLSEDLSQRPSPQPLVFVDVSQPELVMDLRFQLAVDAARRWAKHIRDRLRTIRTASKGAATADDEDDDDTYEHLLALLDLIFSEVKAHFTVERALYSVQPSVSAGSSERINLRVPHLESHLHWCLTKARVAAVEVQLTSSPVVAQWADDPNRILLRVKRGVTASGCIDIHIGDPMRVNANVDINVGEVSAMLRERDFRSWLSMQPLWLVARLADIADDPRPVSFDMPSVDDRRRRLTATARVEFDQLRTTIMACDNDEDVRGKVEHGAQICLASGAIDIRANGGSLESPHSFGFRADVARTTFNVECQRALMFLLSAVAADKARPETRDSAGVPGDFATEDLCGYLPDTIQQHILLIQPRLNFSRHRLEPHRACMIIELYTSSFLGINSVSSVYRWSVFMHHIRYWQRRRKLAQRIATRREEPSKPDDILVSIKSDLLDLRGDLVAPMFFDVARGFQLQAPATAKHVPTLKLKIPQLRFTIEKTQTSTDSDMLISVDGAIATLYGDRQPLVSLSECRIRLRFPRKSKRSELGAQQGVRGNSTHSKIDIGFARGAIALGHRYNMAETIDGYMLMQKACKRIARKSSSTCHPPVSESLLGQAKPTKRQIMAVLGDPRTFVPPPLRELSTAKPPPPPRLREPDDIPSIDFHGPEFTIMVHDDPFETALAQIYQTGLVQQRERLSRLEAFEAKAQEIRSAREHERAPRQAAARVRKQQQQQQQRSQSSKPAKRRHHHHYRRSAKLKGEERSGLGTPLPTGIGRSQTLSQRSSGLASASMQDVRATGRTRTNSMVATESPSRSIASLALDDDDACSSDFEDEVDSADTEIDAAFQRLMEVESREWVRAIRQKMVSPLDADDEQRRQCAGFDEIFGTLAAQMDTRPPYMYRPASWTHRPVPLGRLVMSPVWIAFDTPLALLEFKQVEKYLRYLDPATPHKLEWSTLVPMRMRIKSGDMRMQLRDFPFPLCRVPDPYRQETAKIHEHIDSYDQLRGGFEVSGSLVLAERTAQERSLRSLYIPIGPRTRDAPIDVPNVGWSMAKSLQFPRIFAALSIMLYSAGDRGDARLPQLPIMSAWGACYQPVISALMQRLESATSKSADVSPSLPWWDKLRSRLHYKSRMAVVDAFGLDSERGQMFFLALDGRDPYQVTQKPGSYLFTMRGGVRLCLNEGMPGSELWDEVSGRGIYSVPTEDGTPPSATLSEFMRLRCHEFLMGVPIIIDRQTQIMQFIEAEQEAADTEFVELLRSISSDNSARYTFVTQSNERLYYKVLLHLSGGVRMGIGLSSYIPPDRSGLRHNHWEVHPIAPEAAQTMAVLGIADAYTGYRSTRLHTSVSLLCPFVDAAEHAAQRPFADQYLDDTGATPHLRQPDARVRAKPYPRWNAYDVDALVSPMHSLFASDGSQDLFFAPFSPAPFDSPSLQASPPQPVPQLGQRTSSSTECRISATAAVVEGVQRYLPLYVSRMMLPVRKGSLYPFTEPSDNKIGKCLRSMRLVLDLKSVELAYSQRDYEIKELETRELDILGDRGLSPTPSDISGQQSATGAKAEGILRELKARVESFSFNLLLEQAQVKIRVDSSNSNGRGVGDTSPEPTTMGKGKKRQQQQRSSGVATREANALRWGVGDASLEIDYLDVRLTQLSFMLPLFMDIPVTELPRKCQQTNGLWFLGDSVGDTDLSWISSTSIRDLKELDISEAIFSNPSVVCVLWSPRLVYFTQRPELSPLEAQLDEILDVPISPFDTRRPANADPSASNPALQRSLSAHRARAASDLREPVRIARPQTGGSIDSEDTIEGGNGTHRRNTSMPWTAANNMPDIHSLDTSVQPTDPTEKTPVSAMSYKSSFHLLGLARTRQRRLTASNSRQSINPVQGPHRVGSEHDLIDLQRQTSYPVDQALSNSQITRMMPTGPDPKVIMRDSRSTQAMLLQKRKEMLGAAIMHEQAALAMLSREFEQASSKFNERFRKEMVRRAEHIYELGARRKLINRCLRVLGVSADKTETETEADFDRDTQEVEKVLATLYRHRCLIYSGYLIWTTQVRDKLMRFLYIQDCLTAIEYYMSESAANVVRKATTSKNSAETDASTVRSRSFSQTVDHRHQPADSDEASELAPLPQRQKQRKSGEARSRNRSASQTSAGSSASRRTLRIPKLLRRLRSHEKLSASEPKPSARPRKEGPAKARKRTSKFDKGLSRVWEDFIRYKPYYSIMVEFLNSQVSLRVDESSTTSAIAVAERVQLHRILLCNEGEVTDTPNEPPSDESVVKARSLVELENVQVFTANRSDFENQAAYFVDCTYGSRLDEDASKPTTLWPAWIPIELLLSQGKHQVRGIFDELEETQGVEHSDSDSDRGDAAATGKYGKAWWIEDLSKYKRLMNRNNGLVVYDKANPLRIQSDTADSLRPTSSAESTEPSVGVDAGSATNVAANIAANTASTATAAASGGHPGEASDDENDVNNEPDDTDDPIDDTEAASSEQGLSHRANHFSVFLPELNLACTAEQYIAVYETVTDLLVFIDPEKAAYMDHLNTIQLGMDMSDLRGLLSIIRATQTALRERMPVIYDWYSIQRSRAVLCGSLGLARSRETAGRQRAQASSLLTLDRHRRALELQLRTAMDLFGAAQKQMRRDTAIKGKLVPVQRHASGVSSLGASERPDVPLSECSSQSSSLRSTEETHNTIARTIHLFINKATWHMLENDEQPLCDVTLRWASLKAVTTSDQATHLLSEVHLLYIVNRLPDPMFTDLIGPYIRPKHPKPDFCVEKMIRVQWSELAPVGGISIVERFEVDLFPLRLQLSHDIAQKLINYLYPPQESSAQQPELDPKLESASVQGSDLLSPRRHRRPTMSTIASDDGDSLAAASPPPSSLSLSAQPVPPLSAGDGHGSLDIGSGRSLLHQKIRRPIDEQLRSRAASEAPVSADERSGAQLPRVASGLLATISGRTTPLSLMESNSMINIPQSGDNRDQVDEMKKRASSNKTFLHIKIGGSTLCISYQGRRANNITDLRDFEFHAPMLELRNQVESYFELLMQVKKEYMSVAVQHTGALVKEKFRQLHNRKTWSKTSFGPDWEARRLLIDMDRTIDQEVVASMRNSSNSLVMTTSTEVPGAGPVAQLVENSDLETEESEQLASRESSVAAAASKGKAPLSKYMILDPRKLMGRRLPNILPRPLHEVGQSEPPPSPRLRGQPTNITQDDGRAVSCDPEMHVNASSSSPLRAAPLLNRRFTASAVSGTPTTPSTPRISASSATEVHHPRQF